MLRTVIHKPRQGTALHLTSLCKTVLDQKTYLLRGPKTLLTGHVQRSGVSEITIKTEASTL